MVNVFIMNVLLLPQVGLVLQWHPFMPYTSVTNRPGYRTVDWWLPAFGKETHRPFLLSDLFELWPALPLPGGGGAPKSLQALLPPSITRTLSHCSYHPEHLHFIWELSWLYQSRTQEHKNSFCTDYRQPKHSTVGISAKPTKHVNNVRRNSG